MPNKGKTDMSLNIMLKYKIFLKKLCSTKPAQMVPPHRTKWQPPLKIEQNLHGYYYQTKFKIISIEFSLKCPLPKYDGIVLLHWRI